MNMSMTTINDQQSALRKRVIFLLGCSALSLCVPNISYAQQADSADTPLVLQTITIDGKGRDDDRNSIVANETASGGKVATDLMDTPASVSVITAKEIQQRNAQTVEQVLDYTAGVNTTFYGSDDRFDYFKIRGFDAYMYRDGMSLGKPFGGTREEPFAFERVEVVKGGSSSLFGVSDPGGSVNFTSKKPKSDRFGEAYLSGGSFDHIETGFDFGDNLTEDDTLSYRLTGKFKKSDREYAYSRDDEKFFLGGLTWRPTDATNVTVLYDHLFLKDTPNSGGYPVGHDFSRKDFFGEPDFNYGRTKRDTLTVLADHDFGNGLTLNANARYSKGEKRYGYAYISKTPTDGSTYAERGFMTSDETNKQFIIDTNLQYETSYKNIESRSIVGLEYRNYRGTSFGQWANGIGIDWENPIYSGAPVDLPTTTNRRTKQITKAIYAQQDLTFSEKLTLTLGLRNDWMDIDQDNILKNESPSADLSEFTTRVGAAYRFTDQFMGFVSYAESAVPAAIDAKAERGKQYELGVKYRPDSFAGLFSASIYDLTKSNITKTDPVTLEKSTIGKIRVRGLDLEAKAEITDNVSMTASYSYMDHKILEDNNNGTVGKHMTLVPKHSASLWGNYRWEGSGKRGDMTFSAGVRYIGSYYFDSANKTSTNDNVVFDLAYSYEFIDKTTLQVNVSNVFDKKYVAYGGFGADFYNPGREITATLRRSW
ncbi:TonB-dependent siderophore receptor [Brucellaceae bacterium C25G]